MSLDNDSPFEAPRPEPVHTFLNLTYLAAALLAVGVGFLGWAVVDGFSGGEFGE